MEDGRWHHKFSQSWLKTTDICLERARREHAGTMPNEESDAACVGTAMHLGIESCIAAEGLPRGQVLEIAQDEFTRLMALDGTNGDPNARHPEGVFKWIKYNEKQAREMVATCTLNWYDLVWPTLNPRADVEWEFLLPLVDNSERFIEISGTADYLDFENFDVKDWKTSGRGEYVEWEYKRWAMQPTVYVWAVNQMTLHRPDFEYVVMHKKGVHRFTVERPPEWDAWLKTKVVDIALQIEREVPSWIKSDNHALCSPKWCPAFGDCKGASGITF
jgi:hypothetical protein